MTSSFRHQCDNASLRRRVAAVVRRPDRALSRALIALMVAATLVPGAFASGANAATSASTTNWTVYHGDIRGSGDSTALRSVRTSSPRWRSPTLDGDLYGEPLVDNGEVFIATESDTVYALSSATGHVVWSRHLATPVPSSDLPCGDISPHVGITGTPVIDTARHEIFVVADELRGGKSAHVLVGLSSVNGRVEMTKDVDPTGADPAALLQRTGLTLDHGQVVFAMGGNYGDCSAYRGRVVAVNEVSGARRYFTVDAASGDSQGAIWMGGAAPTLNAQGDVFVAVGNGSVHTSTQPYDDSDSALELSPLMALVQFFAPASWAQDNTNDLDMTMVPALLNDGQIVLAGKSQTAYLLNARHLGGIGNEESTLGSICGNDIDGASAIVGTVLYLPCLSGPVALRASTSPDGLKLLWSAKVGGGPAIVAAGLVWTMGQDGVLYGLNPSTGAVRQQATIGVPANHFPTPSVGDGLLLVTSAARVVAFAGTAS